MSNERNLKVIKASAGSGKTYNLALEYIKQLLFATDESGNLQPRRSLKGPAGTVVNAHHQILAITFTKKATGEMKDRIVKELYVLSQPGGDSKYLKDYMAQSGLNEADVRELARLALQELLFDYTNFNVSTIDSFFQGIMRNFARELDRDFTFELELDDEYAMRAAVHNFLLSLGRYGDGDKMDEWVKQYQRDMLYGSDKAEWKFFGDSGDLFKFAKIMTKETFRNRMGNVRDYLGRNDENGQYRFDFKRIGEFQKYIKDKVKELEQKNTDILQELKDGLEPYGQAGLLKNTLKNWYNNVDGGELVNLPDRFKGADEDKIAKQFKTGHVPSSDVVDRVLDLVTRHYKFVDHPSFLKDISSHICLLGMLAAIDQHLENYRHESNCILISDTNDLIGTVLESGSEFVYERVGTTISHFMIDEFQDTSAKQYENFKTLIAESLANGKFNMLIGDAKQSIYRFRNADLSVFREQVAHDFSEQIDTPVVPSGTATSTNYRSSRAIVEFNNKLFMNMAGRYEDYPSVVETFKDVEQGLPANIDEKAPGYVRVLLGNYKALLPDQGETDGDADADTAPANTGDVDVVTVLPGYLQQLHERFEWGQIGILVNTNEEGGNVVSCILDYNKTVDEDKKIKIISGESLLLTNSSVVNRIIAMLRFIEISQFSAAEDDEEEQQEAETQWAKRMKNRRESDQRLYTALGAFIRETGNADEDDAMTNGKLLAQCLAQTKSAEEAEGANPYEKAVRELLPSQGELTTLVNIVENIIEYIKNDEHQASAVDKEATFLMAFQDMVQSFCNKRNGGTVREFLKYWDAKKAKLAVPSADNGDAVNIMTIHKSKGLEFDCVVIPYANWRLKESERSYDKSYWMPDETVPDLMKSYGLTPCDENIVPPLLNVKRHHLFNLLRNGLLCGKAKDFVVRQLSDTMIDNLNKTYVAFTRAGTELHIFVPDNGDTVKPGPYEKVFDMLYDFATNPQNLMRPIGDTGWYETGRMAPVKVSSDASGQERITSYNVNPMPEQIIVKVEHASSTNIAVGKRLHGMLSRIGDRNDVDRTVSNAMKHGSITANPDDACNIDFVNEHVVKPIKDADGMIGKWFDPENKVYAERTMTTANRSWEGGSDIDNLRPDRIVRRPDGTWIVIDYKSGELSVEDKDNPGQYIDFTGKYCRQVRRYIERLRATGLVPDSAAIEGRIWFIKHGTVLDADTGRQLYP